MVAAGCLTEIECPQCHEATWIIDSTYRGRDGAFRSYAERINDCPSCGRRGAGWTLKQQSPPAFLSQPHELYPMTQEAFDYWVAILTTHFPDQPQLAGLGETFRPYTPEEFAAAKEAHEREYPVGEMRDQDGARRKDPTTHHAAEWVEIMTLGDSLSFLRHDGGELRVTKPPEETFSVRCTGTLGNLIGEALAIDRETVLRMIDRYLEGDVKGCVAQLLRRVR
jgi:hypothetical protein